MKRLAVLLLLLSLAACAPFVKDGQPTTTSTQAIILHDDQTLGQTLLARDRGLQSIEIFLGPETAGNGEIQLHLRADSQSSTDLAVSSLPMESITTPGWVRFTFPPQSDSRQKDYFFLLKIKGTGQVRVETAPGDAYLDGALYQNKSPLDAQMTFRLVYDPSQLLLGILVQFGSWLGVLGIAIFLFILPGWGLLAWFWPGWNILTWGEKAGVSAGLSLAIYPVFFLWTDLVGIHLGALYAWLPPLLGLGIVIWQGAARWKIGGLKVNLQPATFNRQVIIPDLALFIILVLIFFTRFWVIRSLEVPMWGDSYQHTMIAQLLVDHGGLFNSWQPYAELETFTYHFGFHSAVAVFHWIGGMDMPLAVLWMGQVLNALAVLAIYPLAVRVGSNRWAGLAAVLLAGLFSPMPMYYVNWGRYTQLAGQVILPAAIYFAWEILLAQSQDPASTTIANSLKDKIRRLVPVRPAPLALTWVVWGGLALTHYRVLIFAALFFVAFLFLYARRETWSNLFLKIFWMEMGAAILFLPRFVEVFGGKILLVFARQMSTPAAATSAWVQGYNLIDDLSFYLPTWLWLLFPLAMAWGLWRREKGVVLISLWWFLILLAANPQWLHLPGEGALSNFAVFIAAYIPVSVLAGDMLGQTTRGKWKVGSGNILAAVLLILVFSMGTWGARQRLQDFNLIVGALVTPPDVRAAEWIQENTPQDSRFLVNSFFAYGDTVIVGSDGGWWLPLLAQRHTTLPPLNYDSERGPRPDYVHWINNLTTEIQTKGIAHPNVLTLLRERGVTYVYIGQRQGRVNYGGPYVLEPGQLLASPNFRLVYHQDRVWVFEIQR